MPEQAYVQVVEARPEGENGRKNGGQTRNGMNCSRTKLGIWAGILFLLVGGIVAGLLVLRGNAKPDPEEKVKASKVIQICDSRGCVSRCNPGYVLVKQKCLPPTSLKNCTLPVVDNGTVTAEGGGYNVRCLPGYRLAGTGNLTCTNGTMEEAVPTCIEDSGPSKDSNINNSSGTTPTPGVNNTADNDKPVLVANATKSFTDPPKLQLPTPLSSRSPLIEPTSSTIERSTEPPRTPIATECLPLTKKDSNHAAIGERLLYSIDNRTGIPTYCKPYIDISKGAGLIQSDCEQRVHCDRRGARDNKFIIRITERDKGPPLHCKICSVISIDRDVHSCVKSRVSDCGGRFMREWIRNSGCAQCVGRFPPSCERICNQQSLR